jgi:hypothetical protein
VAEPFGRVLLGEVQPVAEGGELLALEDRPVLPAKALHHVVIEPAEIFAIQRLLARLRDDADLLDA